MTFRDFAGAIIRNWTVAVAVGLITLIFAYQAVTAAPAYQTRAIITLLSPETPFPRNAYASFTPGLEILADVSARTMETAQARRAVRRAGGHAEFQVILFNRGTEQYPIYDQPYLTVLTKADNPQDAEATRTAVMRVLGSELRNRQVATGAQEGSLVSWRVTASATRAAPVTGEPTRGLVAIMMIGFIGAIYAALIADRHELHSRMSRGLSRWRRRRITGAPPRPSRPAVGAGSR